MVDSIDERIISALEHDGRMSVRALAEQLHISRANAYARIQRLRDNEVLTGFTATVDPVARGLGTTAYVTLNVEQRDWRRIRTELARLPGIEHIALVGGEFDVIILVRARDNLALRSLVLDDIHNIDGVLNSHTLLVFDEPAIEFSAPNAASDASAVSGSSSAPQAR